MIETADWFHIQWLLLYFVINTQHGNDSLALETARGHVWEELDNIGRKACTHNLVCGRLMKNGIVLQFLRRNLDVVNPCVRVMIEETYQKLCGSLNQIMMWDCLTSQKKSVGKEYLVHHSSYETLLPYLCSAFYRSSWERPVVFWFLNPVFDRVWHHGRHVIKLSQEHVDIVDDGGEKESLSGGVVKSSVYRKARSGRSTSKTSKREARTMRRKKMSKEKRAGRQTLKKFKIMHQHTTRYSEIENDPPCDDYLDDYPDYPDDSSDYSYDDEYQYYSYGDDLYWQCHFNDYY